MELHNLNLVLDFCVTIKIRVNKLQCNYLHWRMMDYSGDIVMSYGIIYSKIMIYLQKILKVFKYGVLIIINIVLVIVAAGKQNIRLSLGVPL